MHFLLHHYGRPGDLEFVRDAAERTEQALQSFEAGNAEQAHDLWASVDGPKLLETWDSWNEQIRLLGPRWSLDRPQPIGPPGGVVTATMAKRIYERDRYRCRYCGMPVFTRWKGSRIRNLISAFPDLTPGMRVVGNSLVGTGKNGGLCNVDYQKILWSMAAPDHVFPRSLGGDATFENLVTSCSGCNYGKGELALEQMKVRPPRPFYH
jgi:5-methylcytosine-specific restriction endonuclease McrA